jgi:hypothetical protein
MEYSTGETDREAVVVKVIEHGCIETCAPLLVVETKQSVGADA